MKRRDLILYPVGILFSLMGIFLGLLVFWPKSHEKVSYLEIQGNKKVTREEILAAVEDILKEDGANYEKIQEVLLMNPRILNVNFSKVKNGHYLLQIKEKKTLYFEHTPQGLREYAEDGQILQEQAEKSVLYFPESEIPIFYLTEKVEKVDMVAAIKSDIISLVQKTYQTHAFVWQRVSEFEIAPANSVEKKGVELILYPVTVPAKIVVNMAINMGFLERLWSILYYLEKYYPRTRTIVELYEQNAVVTLES